MGRKVCMFSDVQDLIGIIPGDTAIDVNSRDWIVVIIDGMRAVDVPGVGVVVIRPQRFPTSMRIIGKLFGTPSGAAGTTMFGGLKKKLACVGIPCGLPTVICSSRRRGQIVK